MNYLKAFKIGEVAEEKLDSKQHHNVKNDKKPKQSFLSLVTCGLMS
ncbi:unnamed protein product [Acanthoscelides obtectus]|nr:unnamed protein product [Acanthoscelides obtectus]CAK1622387.1 hypothetical protein AOBTE_LOCUS1461 [Acanthoscelides obtectus]